MKIVFQVNEFYADQELFYLALNESHKIKKEENKECIPVQVLIDSDKNARVTKEDVLELEKNYKFENRLVSKDKIQFLALMK